MLRTIWFNVGAGLLATSVFAISYGFALTFFMFLVSLNYYLGMIGWLVFNFLAAGIGDTQFNAELRELWANRADDDDVAIRALICILLRIITQFTIDYGGFDWLGSELMQARGWTGQPTEFEEWRMFASTLLTCGFSFRLVIHFNVVDTLWGNNWMGRNGHARRVLWYILLRAVIYSLFPHLIQMLTKLFNI